MEIVEIDKELAELETKIDQLRGLYEQYFMGLEKLEPQIPRRDVERRVKILRREQIRNTAQRFKFNTLVQRLNTLTQHWNRVVREIENGTYKRDVIRAAARFGDRALVGVGKQKAKLAAAAGLSAKRPADDEVELDADDLIEDDDELAAPTPPPRHAQPAPVSAYGLGPGDLPVVGHSPAQPGPEQRLTPQPAAPAPAPAGLRWGANPAASSSDPASAIRPAAVDVKRRVAELAAEMRAPRAQEARGGGFGDLDLDFGDGSSGRRAVETPPAAATSRAALPARAGTPAPRAAPTAARPAPQGGFGVLDIPLDAIAPAPAPAPSPSSPGSGVRNGVGAVARSFSSVQRPPAAAAPPAAAPADSGDLGDQRIRQIYAKYVETKRSTQESTAGVTFEKLAATLRAQAEKLKGAHPSKSIDYEVVVKDGKTHLKPVLK